MLRLLLSLESSDGRRARPLFMPTTLREMTEVGRQREAWAGEARWLRVVGRSWRCSGCAGMVEGGGETKRREVEQAKREEEWGGGIESEKEHSNPFLASSVLTGSLAFPTILQQSFPAPSTLSSTFFAHSRQVDRSLVLAEAKERHERTALHPMNPVYL